MYEYNDMVIKYDMIVYWARFIPQCGIADVIEVKIRTIYDDGCFIGVEPDTHIAYTFNRRDMNVRVFRNRNEAVLMIDELKVEYGVSKISKEIGDDE